LNDLERLMSTASERRLAEIIVPEFLADPAKEK
jgi:hypothetical protein